jgi:hypothetical protein
MSYELRWFHKGNIPKKIDRWFTNDKFFKEQTPANHKFSDCYLHTTKLKCVSVKFRGKKLDIKWCKADYPIPQMNGVVNGMVEDWLYWTWNDAQAEDKIDLFIKRNKNNDPWITLNKKRLQRKYNIISSSSSSSNNHTLMPISDKEKINKADCAIELTRMEVKGKLWWSLGIDAYYKNGEDSSNCKRNMKIAVDWFFRDYPKHNLRMKNSFSYPQLLSEI